MKQYDIIVVGTGGATIVADAALKKGLKVAIIEKGKFGGTCLTRGCIPTKVMVTAANAHRPEVMALASERREGRGATLPFPRRTASIHKR